MAKFNIGDKVKRISAEIENYPLTTIFTVEPCDVEGYINISLNGKGVGKNLGWVAANFSLVERCNTAKSIENKYSFIVPSLLVIDFEDIRSELSRSNPIALITAGKDRYVVVHKSILRKAALLEIKSPSVGCTNVEFPKPISGKFTEYLTWVRLVKSTPWKKQKDTKQVKVVIPKV